MKRLRVLLLLMGASGCNAQEWNFSDDSGAPAADATAESSLPASDASSDTGYSHKGDEGGTSLGRCTIESDCARFGLHCLLSPGLSGICVPCLSDTDCQQDPVRPHCDQKLYRCVECETSGDCQPGEVCLPEPTHSCVTACPTDMVTCPAGAAFCLNGICAACNIASDCRHGQICDRLSGRCGECISDADCRGRLLNPKCDRTASTCVQCLHNSDCGRGVCSPLGTCIGLGVFPWWDE